MKPLFNFQFRISASASVLALIFNLLPLAVQAAPAKFHRCDLASKISTPADSQGYYFDSSNCKTVYVLPPVDGKLVVGSYVSNNFEGVCDLINSGVDAIKQQSQRVNQQQAALNAIYADVTTSNAQVERLMSACSKKEQGKIKLEGQKTILNTRLEKAQSRLQQLVEEKANCVEGDLECINLEYEIMDAKMTLSDLKEQAFAVEEKLSLITSQYEVCLQNRDSQIQKIVDKESRYQTKSNALMVERLKLKNLLQRMNTEHAGKDGATLSVHFYSGQNDLIQKFKELNADLNLDFQPMPIKKGILSFQPINDDALEGLPVIRKSSISGLRANTEINGLSASELATDESASANLVFGQGAGGVLTINQVAACDLQRQFEGLSKEAAATRIADLLAPTVTFQYDVIAGKSLTIQYNESHLYQLIKRQTKSNGLFSSHTSNSLLESSEAEKWLNVVIESEDTGNSFENSELTALEIRRNYLDAALMKVAKSYLSTAQTEMIEPGASGAAKASERLKDCGYSYCQYASLVLDLGNALFGGSTADVDMRRIVKAQERIQLKENRPITLYGTQSLKRSQ